VSRVQWMTFCELRGDAEPRDWIRWSELLAWAMAELPGMGQWDVRLALRGASKPAKRYGHYRYTNEHKAAIRAYAERAWLTGGSR
jgi:hypothetical protein